MKRRHTAASASVAAVTLVVAAHAAIPAAHALTPPAIDDSLLPAPAVPTPPRPTTQLEVCASPAAATGPVAATPDLLRLAAVRPLSRGEGQRVAVLDTGVTPHRRLARVEAAGDYVSTGDGTQDCDGHGTLVAGIIAATADHDDPTGFAGVAPAATVLSIRQSSTKFGSADDPTHPGFGDVTTLAAAVRTAADLGATVINISSIACAAGGIEDGALGAALAYAVDTKDIVVVAAAGNVGGAGRCPRQQDGESTWDTATVAASPGWYDDYVLTVGSVGPDGTPSDFSLPGPWVDIAAPGEQVVSLHPGGSGIVAALPAFGRDLPISGTSYAAPVVSGVAALVRSRFPALTAREVMRRIEITARPLGAGWNAVTGNGIVDPVAALSAEAPTARPAPPPSVALADTTPEAPHAESSSDGRAPTIALIGTGVCAAAVTAAALITRSRRPGGEGVVGGERS